MTANPGHWRYIPCLCRTAFCPLPGSRKAVQKTQITFTAPKVFSCVSMMNVRPAKRRPKEYIVITFGLNQRVLSPRMDAAAEPYPGHWTHHVLVAAPEEIDDELLGWVQAAYRFSLMK